MNSDFHASEPARLATLHIYQILDTPAEAVFDALVKVAAQICETPFAALSFIDMHRQWFKSYRGLPMQEVTRDVCFCAYTIEQAGVMIVPDTLLDPRFVNNPLVVGEPYIRFYAGVPLIAPDGSAVGTLAVMDRVPRQLSEAQIDALGIFAEQAMNRLEARLLMHKQREVERTLSESEKRFQRLFLSAAAGISLRYPRGKFIQANPAFCEMVGYSEDELRGLDARTLIHPDDRAVYEKMIDQLLANEVESVVLEKRYQHKQGHDVWARASISCVHSESGEPTYVIAIAEDITDRVRAQQYASGLQERLAMTLEHMTDAFCLLDHEWRISYLNKVAEELVLHTTEEVRDVKLWERFPPTAGSLLYTEFHRAVEEGTPAHFELFYPPLNNWFEVHAYPVPDGLAVYFRATTEQKHAIEELRASEERFKIVARATNDTIWDWDLTTDALWWSEGLETMFGYRPDEVVPDIRAWTRLIHPDDEKWVTESVNQLIARGGDHWSGEYRFVAKDGSVRHVLDRGHIIYNANGVPMRMVGSLVDLTEYKRAEEALRESEERFRQMAESIDDVFWIWDPIADRILYASPRYEQIFGHPREELYSNPRAFEQDMHPEDIQRLRQSAARDPLSIKMDYRLQLDNQRVRWVSVRTYPVYNDDGTLRYTVGIGQDITALKEANEQLRLSEEQYRLLFANNPHPMWVYDRETLRFMAVNKQAVQQYGYSEAEFLSMTIRDIRPSEDLPRLIEKLADLTTSRNHTLWKHRRKDGSLFDAEISSDAIVFGGRHARLVLANDVTERRRASEKIRQQAALLDKAQDAIMVCDLDHHITYWNDSATRIYGWRADEAIGKTTMGLLYQDPSAFLRAHQQLLEKGEWFGELHQVDRQGNHLLVEVRWTLLHDEIAGAERVLSINTDVTERKRLEAQFMRAQRLESIGTLAGGIAHDLNNVLAPILLSLGMLKRKTNSPVEQKLLTTLESSAQRGADMVRQVLSFARGVDGERVVVDVGQVVRDLENLIRETFDRSIQFTVAIGDNLSPVLGDPTQIHQVILNLCVNARDAMPEGGTLEIAVSSVQIDSPFASMDLVAEPGIYVVLSVSDTGVGIPPDVRERIFDPFFTTKDVGKGTGLGLSTVQAVVKSHGGFINVYSEVGKGTEFKVYLPALEDQSSRESEAQSVSLPYSNGELVLVIDDEPAIRQITQQTLESFGYRVLTAEDGAEALSIYAKYQRDISIVLTDMMMPGMDGFALIEALRARNPAVKVVAASGLADADKVTKASRIGVSYFLQKPYTTESLLKALSRISAGRD